MSIHCRSLAVAAACLLFAGSAEALSSWSLVLSPSAGGWDDPTFALTNTSTAGETITDLSITIGDTSYHFDAVAAADPSEALTGASLISPDRAQNNWWSSNGRSDTLDWSFTDFQVGETLVFTVDLDIDFLLIGSVVDARTVLFNNDFPLADPNAVVSVGFSDGSVASLTLPDAGLADAYQFWSNSTGAGGHHVPEPTPLLLLGLGLVGLAWFGEPRRPAAP